MGGEQSLCRECDEPEQQLPSKVKHGIWEEDVSTGTLKVCGAYINSQMKQVPKLNPQPAPEPSSLFPKAVRKFIDSKEEERQSKKSLDSLEIGSTSGNNVVQDTKLISQQPPDPIVQNTLLWKEPLSFKHSPVEELNELQPPRELQQLTPHVFGIRKLEDQSDVREEAIPHELRLSTIEEVREGVLTEISEPQSMYSSNKKRPI